MNEKRQILTSLQGMILIANYQYQVYRIKITYRRAFAPADGALVSLH